MTHRSSDPTAASPDRPLQATLTQHRASRLRECAKGTFAEGHVIAGRYRLGSLLGRGRQGSVHLARDLTRQQAVALKILRGGEGAPASLLSELNHPRVQRLLDSGHDNEVVYRVLHLHHGRPLDALLAKRGAFPAWAVRGLGGQLLSALGYLHARQILHRDVKPANLLVERRGLVLIDFDLAAYEGEDEEDGFLVGTPLFMSRERIMGRRVGPQDDVYACALVLYAMTYGATPTGPSDPESLADLWSARGRPLATGSALDSFFARALSIRESDRFATAEEAALALCSRTWRAARTRRAPRLSRALATA